MKRFYFVFSNCQKQCLTHGYALGGVPHAETIKVTSKMVTVFAIDIFMLLHLLFSTSLCICQDVDSELSCAACDQSFSYISVLPSCGGFQFFFPSFFFHCCEWTHGILCLSVGCDFSNSISIDNHLFLHCCCTTYWTFI